MAEGWGLAGEADAAKKFLDVRFHKSLGEHALLRA